MERLQRGILPGNERRAAGGVFQTILDPLVSPGSARHQAIRLPLETLNISPIGLGQKPGAGSR
jgi:hypothetical protein